MEEKSTGFSDWYINDSPKKLDDIFGQDTIVKYFRAKMKTGNFDRSTMFIGKFGTGKTALAKILAKAIACKDVNENGEPCNSCATCLAVDEERWNRDVVYIDAEQSSAQDVRDIVERTMASAAIRDHAKVIICDEAQALSKEAVEAFLTATQNPKKGFFFIFTAMDKLQGSKSAALQSRCKVWKMKMPKPDEIYTYLIQIAIKKGLTKETTIPKEFFTEGLKLIAENSEYSFRKAIQSLEQCYNGRIFELNEIKQTLDIVSYDDAVKMLIDIGNGQKTKTVWDSIIGTDFQEKFGLLLKIVGDAQAFKTFGYSFIDEEDKWRWGQAKVLSESPRFGEIRDAFVALSEKSFIKRGDWEITCAKLLDNMENITKKVGRSRPGTCSTCDTDSTTRSRLGTDGLGAN